MGSSFQRILRGFIFASKIFQSKSVHLICGDELSDENPEKEVLFEEEQPICITYNYCNALTQIIKY